MTLDLRPGPPLRGSSRMSRCARGVRGRLILLVTALLCTILYLSLDQAGAPSYVGAPSGEGEPGLAVPIHVDAPPGRYALAVRLRIVDPTPLKELVVTFADQAWVRNDVRTSSPWPAVPTVDVPMGDVTLASRGIHAVVETSPGSATVRGLVLEPHSLVRRPTLQRILGSLALVLALTALASVRKWRSALILALPLLLLCGRLLVFHLVPCGPVDMRLAFFPWHDLSLREFGAGRLPLWNPFTFLGLPHLANLQTQVIYPPVLACLVAGASFANREFLVQIMNLLLAGTGAASVARRGGCSRTSSLVSGLLFMLSPSLLNPEQAPVACVTAVLPWAIFFVLRRDGALPLAVTLAAGVLAGHIQMFSYLILAVVVTVAWPTVPRRRALSLVGVLVAFALGALLSAALAVPLLEYGLASTRGAGLAPSHAALGSLSSAFLVRALSTEWETRWVSVMPSGRSAASIALGLMGLPLAAAGLADVTRRSRRRFVGWILLLGGCGIAVGLGDRGPLSPWVLLSHVPLFSSQRAPWRAIVLLVLAGCVLCGRGVDRLKASVGRGGALCSPLLVGAALLGLGLFSLRRGRHLDAEVLRGALTQGAILLGVATFALLARRRRRALGVALMAVVLAERFDDAFGQRPGGFPAQYRAASRSGRAVGRGLRELEVSMAANDVIVSRRLSPWGYDPVIPLRTAQLWNFIRPTLFTFDERMRLLSIGPNLKPPDILSARAAQVLELMGVGQVLATRTAAAELSPLARAHLQPRRSRGLQVLLALPAARRARLVSQDAAVRSSATALATMRGFGRALDLLARPIEMEAAGEETVAVDPGPRGWETLAIQSFTSGVRSLAIGTEVGRVRAYEGENLRADVPLRLGIETAEASADEPFVTRAALPQGARPDRMVVTRAGGTWDLRVGQLSLGREDEAGDGPIPLVVEDPDAPVDGLTRCHSSGEPRVHDVAPCEVTVELPRHARGYLVLSDAFFPGWEAVIDGKLQPILPADIALRAVRLSGDEREVVFRYRPFSFRLGLFGSLVGATIALLRAMRRRGVEHR